jgi:large subunit ribosomal protein L18
VKYDADGDKVIATARATDLKKLGWTGSCGNTPAAYLTGLLLASKTKVEGDIIIDIGLQHHHKGGKLYAVAKGAIEGGLGVRVSEEVLPADDRTNGMHVNEAMKNQVATIKAKIKK